MVAGHQLLTFSPERRIVLKHDNIVSAADLINVTSFYAGAIVDEIFAVDRTF